jgi:geranylgeranyl diphosphate synthase type II
MFETIFNKELTLFDTYLKSVLAKKRPCPSPALEGFWECMGYSLHSEGKRFRPLLALLTAKALKKDPERVLPLAASVELIHTYSLIHDDLPVMDDDDVRRGRPTNHKVFGEAPALLAGDALLTLAFGILAEADSPCAPEAIRLLSKAAGPAGMVGGQVLDIEAKDLTQDKLADIHRLKTGALIAVSVEAAAALLGASPEERAALSEYGRQLGLAFQLADDLQDFDPENLETVNYANLIGVEGTRRYLERVSGEALAAIKDFDSSAESLREMIRLNSKRV